MLLGKSLIPWNFWHSLWKQVGNGTKLLNGRERRKRNTKPFFKGFRLLWKKLQPNYSGFFVNNKHVTAVFAFVWSYISIMKAFHPSSCPNSWSALIISAFLTHPPTRLRSFTHTHTHCRKPVFYLELQLTLGQKYKMGLSYTALQLVLMRSKHQTKILIIPHTLKHINSLFFTIKVFD